MNFPIATPNFPIVTLSAAKGLDAWSEILRYAQNDRGGLSYAIVDPLTAILNYRSRRFQQSNVRRRVPGLGVADWDVLTLDDGVRNFDRTSPGCAGGTDEKPLAAAIRDAALHYKHTPFSYKHTPFGQWSNRFAVNESLP